MKVRDPQGRTWRVSRRWVPWRRRLKGALDLAPDLPSGFVDDGIGAVIGLIILAPFLVLALVAGIELLALLVVLPIALLGRVLFGRHWTIEVRRGFRPYWEQLAGDWQASGVQIHEVADAIRRGDPPERSIAG